MRHSPTPTELLALKTANAALLNSPDSFCDLVSTVVFALGSAQLLQSPETAAELAELRAQIVKRETQSSRVRTDELVPGDRVWHPYDMARFTVEAAAETLLPPLRFHNRATDEYETGMRVTGTDDSGEVVHVDTAPSYLWHREDATSEVAALRARVAELEAERHSTNEALSEATEALRVQRDRIAELEALKPAPVQTCRSCGAGYGYGQPCSTCHFQGLMDAELRRVEAERPEAGVTHRCGIPLVQRLKCGHCPRHELCQDCDRCPHSCRCGELAEQRHLVDPLDRAMEALAPRTTTTIETSGSAL